MNDRPEEFSPQCPLPLSGQTHIQLAHGGGGTLMQSLIQELFLPAFPNELALKGHDAAVLEIAGARLAFTTDSYVIRPLFFPGGDIGTLAVNGTVNDLAMSGARPLYLSVGMILEEGLPMESLQRVVASMSRTAAEAGVQLVTGDTKVVDKGKGDGLYVNTAGVGVLEHDLPIGPGSLAEGDAILVSGDVGRHGTAVMAVREGLEFESTIESDCAGLARLVQALLNEGLVIHCLRDLTRGGLATALVELAEASGHTLQIRRPDVPIREDVQGACEMLGLDPLYVANEGRMVVFVPSVQADQALDIMRANAPGTGAARIGEVTGHGKGGRVVMESEIGTRRILDMLSGEQLPRIC